MAVSTLLCESLLYTISTVKSWNEVIIAVRIYKKSDNIRNNSDEIQIYVTCLKK
jgi:hypothetical protein